MGMPSLASKPTLSLKTLQPPKLEKPEAAKPAPQPQQEKKPPREEPAVRMFIAAKEERRNLEFIFLGGESVVAVPIDFGTYSFEIQPADGPRLAS